MGLADKRCTSCDNPDIPRLTLQEAEELNKQVEGWNIEEVKGHLQISKEFWFADFKESLGFVDKVGVLAEEQGHHPNIYIIYNKVKIVLYTHIIRGLHENDFVMAAKIERLFSKNS